MQTVDNSIKIVRKEDLFGPSKTLTSVQEVGKHIPTFIPIAQMNLRAVCKRELVEL